MIYLTHSALGAGLLALAACTTAAAPNALPEHAINVGGNGEPSDIDSCINNGIDSMEGTWVMRFAVSNAKGKVSRAEGKLRIKRKSEGRWTILRPDKDGVVRDYSVITNYGYGELASIAVGEDDDTIYEETFLECHEPDASGRFRYVSLMEPSSGPFSDSMTITRTGWGTTDHHYSIDVIEFDDGRYAISTRAGERVGGLVE